ncbi:MAG: DNA polymerase III subunit delta [Candidatus Kerfeldbacteria bacterium]|nr:DNA polymerase III subunit delta [Candidatus Kerfeldbacteria bacterium]
MAKVQAKTKAPISNSKSTGLAVQLWFGENQSLLGLEATRWREEFRKRHPQAILVRLEYEKKQTDELEKSLQQAVWGGGLFSEKKLIELTNFLQADGKSGLAMQILSLVESLPPGVFVVFIETEKVLWSKNLPAAFKKLITAGKVAVREFNDLSSLELEKWISQQFKQQGVNVSPLVARQLAAMVGNDFLKLIQEIVKLTAYRQGGEIKIEDINLLVESDLKDDTFVLLTAVAKRDLAAATNALARQFRQGVSSQQLVGMLTWHLRTLMSVRQALDSSRTKLSAKQLAEETGLHPFVINKVLQQIPYYSAKKIAWLYAELSDLDIKLKTSRVEPEARFGWFLSKLATLSINQT